MVRKRPVISFTDNHPHTAPRDKKTFPSGHTMNAVNFAVLFTWAYPPLAYIVIPFAFLVALSRVILGMHYPTDVVVGAALGIILSWTSLLLFPLGMFANVLN
ncbi:MAG: phosphatase PAP2 family protein [Pseudomonadota bacterium]|nr:phosphatase PAP2 family protein [Pseudomonadota bacterium]